MLNLKPYESEIKIICDSLNLKKLALFGSSTSESFNAASDVDVLVEFGSSENENLFDTYFKLKEGLENIFHRQVDIIVENSIKNPFLKKSVDSTKRTIYVG